MLPFTLLDNNEFLLLLLDIYSVPTYLNKDNFEQVYSNLNDKLFFQTTDNEEHRHDKFLNSIDPDLNYSVNDICKYTINPETITMTSTEQLTLMTFNIRSIKKNFDNFLHLICSMNCKIHIICLTESWLGDLDNINDYKLDGYNIPYFQNRSNNSPGGGVITYIHQDIREHKAIKQLSFVDKFNHCMATEITVCNKKMTVLNMYRSPNNENETFIDKFQNIIEKIKTKTCYVLGDMNYNLVNLDKHAATKTYYDTLTTASFKPLITKPTRITKTNATLIDHIWTNDLRHDSVYKSHIIITDISDHLPCISFIISPQFNLKGYKSIRKRVINETNRIKFRQRITEIKDILNFQVINKSEKDLETRYKNYFDQLSMAYNECFPFTTKKIHSKLLSKPWITPKIQKLINKKNKGFSIKSKKRTVSNKTKYKIAKQEMEKAIENEKQNYYKKLLDNTNNNIKKKWNAIRLIINRKKMQPNNCTLPSSILGNH